MNAIGINIDMISGDFANRLNVLSNDCNKYSLEITDPEKNPLEWLPFAIEKFIIIVINGPIPTETITKENLANGNILNYSIGHCYFFIDNTKLICGLLNVCLHSGSGGINHKKDDKPNYLEDDHIGGWDSKLLEHILSYIAIYVPNYGISDPPHSIQKSDNMITIWLCINVANKNFHKVVDLYAKHGFKDPILRWTDPWGTNWKETFPYGLLHLTRKNVFLVESEINREFTIHSVLYSIEKFNHNMIDTSCNTFYRFDEEYIDLMRLLSQGASSLNKDGSVTQKEVSGRYIIDDNEEGVSTYSDGTTEDTVIWILVVDKDNIIYGEEGCVIVPHNEKYTFHSHPQEAYKLTYGNLIEELLQNQGVPLGKVNVGHPSGGDYIASIKRFVEGEAFHTVLSVQGIYIIHLQEQWMNEKGIQWLRDNLEKKIPLDDLTCLKKQAFDLWNPIFNSLTFPIVWAAPLQGCEPIINTTFNLYKDYLYYRSLYHILDEIIMNDIQTNEELIKKTMSIYWGYNWNNITLEYSCKLYSQLSSIIKFREFSPLFNIQFMSWDEAKSGNTFSANFLPISGNCFTSRYDKESFDDLFNTQVLDSMDMTGTGTGPT